MLGRVLLLLDHAVSSSHTGEIRAPSRGSGEGARGRSAYTAARAPQQRSPGTRVRPTPNTGHGRDRRDSHRPARCEQGGPLTVSPRRHVERRTDTQTARLPGHEQGPGPASASVVPQTDEGAAERSGQLTAPRVSHGAPSGRPDAGPGALLRRPGHRTQHIGAVLTLPTGGCAALGATQELQVRAEAPRGQVSSAGGSRSCQRPPVGRGSKGLGTG